MNAIAQLINYLFLKGLITGAALSCLFFIFILMLGEIIKNERSRNS